MGGYLYQSNKDLELPQSITIQYLWQNSHGANFNYHIKKEVGFPSEHNLFSTYPLLNDKFYIRIGYLSDSSELFFSSIKSILFSCFEYSESFSISLISDNSSLMSGFSESSES